jgi:hypothetical protein
VKGFLWPTVRAQYMRPKAGIQLPRLHHKSVRLGLPNLTNTNSIQEQIVQPTATQVALAADC